MQTNFTKIEKSLQNRYSQSTLKKPQVSVSEPLGKYFHSHFV